jgi:hypothetical protein
MAALKDAAVHRHIHDLGKLRTRELQGASGSRIIRIAGNPKRVDLEFPRKGNQQPNGTSGKMMSAMGGCYVKPNVTGIALDMRCRSDPQVDSS